MEKKISIWITSNIFYLTIFNRTYLHDILREKVTQTIIFIFLQTQKSQAASIAMESGTVPMQPIIALHNRPANGH